MYFEEETIDYKLRTHEQYIDLLQKLKRKTAYIILVQIDGEDKEDQNLQTALSCMQLLEQKKTGHWLGTITKRKRAVSYLFRADQQYFTYLESLSSFFYFGEDQYGCDKVDTTEFGLDDIAFLDADKKVLFFTTTHEGYANISPKIETNRFRQKVVRDKD